jgi:hypothetical protein
MSTENFNHTAAAGALLGGAVIASENAMADGRHGLEFYPARLWSWGRGASQENIDHYYLALTIAAQKALFDFAPTPFDRLLSAGILAKSLDEVVAAYHPGLKRFISGSSRTSLEYLLAKQDGLQYVLHTLSRIGALHDLTGENAGLPGLDSVIGQELTPTQSALQAVASPWGPDWMVDLIDDKPIPFRSLAAGDGVATSYLGSNYGIASISRERRVQFLAQWRRDPRSTGNLQDLVTVVARFGVNDSGFANDAWGWIAPLGTQTTLQHDNKAMFFGGPRDASFLRERVQKEGLRSLQNSLAFFNYEKPIPSWEIFVDGQRVTRLPFITRANARIIIRDGVIYFGVIPLKSTELGKGSGEVLLREGTSQVWNGISFKPALVIDSYNLRSEAEVAPDWAQISKALGGFAVEIGDAADYSTLQDFREHMDRVAIEVRTTETGSVEFEYQSDRDRLETDLSGLGRELALVEPKINGTSASLHPGIQRDTTIAIQGSAARLEKLGAVLDGDEGKTRFLQVAPKSETFVAWNPLPDLSQFALALPDKRKIEADGRIGLTRLEIKATENRIAIQQAWKPGQDQQSGVAQRFVLTGFGVAPTVELNGKEVLVGEENLMGKKIFVVPLREDASPHAPFLKGNKVCQIVVGLLNPLQRTHRKLEGSGAICKLVSPSKN